MTDTAPTVAGSVSTATRGGASADWTGPSNAKVSDNTYATNAMTAIITPTYYLLANLFGFSIPAGSTINNVAFSIERKATGSSGFQDSTVHMLLAGSPQANNKANLGVDWPNTDTVVIYTGDPQTFWGCPSPLTPADVNDTGFGVRLSVASTVTGTVSVDSISCTVSYTLASGKIESVSRNLPRGVLRGVSRGVA